MTVNLTLLNVCTGCAKDYSVKSPTKFTGNERRIDGDIELEFECKNCGKHQWLTDYWYHNLERAE